MNANDEVLTSSLAMLSGGFDDAELDRRVTSFQDRLRQLRDDPAEAARIDALVMDAERGEPDLNVVSGPGLTIYVNGGVVSVNRGEQDEAAAVRERAEARLAVLERELLRRIQDLEVLRDETSARPRPRRMWEAVLGPAFGGGVLVAILAAATVITALHVPAAIAVMAAAVLAAAAAVAAFLSVFMPWTSVRELNRRGDAHIALELLSRGTRVLRSAERAGDDEPAVRPPTGKLGRHPAPNTASSGPVRRARSSEPAARGGVRTLTACANCAIPLDEGDAFCGNCGVAV
jgi:hypothetical protein